MCHFFLDTLTSINPCTFCNPTLPSLIYTGGEDQCSVGSGDVSLSLVSAVLTQATALVSASELTSRFLFTMAICWEASSHEPRKKLKH